MNQSDMLEKLETRCSPPRTFREQAENALLQHLAMGIGAEQCRLAVKLGEEGYTRPIGWRGILLGHVIVENRKGLVVAACATPSSTTAEREAALQMLEAMGRSAEGVKGQTPLITLGADTLYQEQKFIAELRRKVVPQEIQNTLRAGCDVRLEQT